MTREQMIYECCRKLPYPVSFYKSISEESLFHIWNKHVVQNIPINKRQLKKRQPKPAKAAPEYVQLTMDDLIRQHSKEEQEQPLTMEEYARRCLNRGEVNSITNHIFGENTCRIIIENGLTVEEYMEIMVPPREPSIFYSELDGCYYRKDDASNLTLIPDEELSYIKEAGENIGFISAEEAPVKNGFQKTLKRKIKPD